MSPKLDMATSRSWLFVPGDRPGRFASALSSGADEVIVDLEDGVAPEAKEAARGTVGAWLSGGASAWVRINAWGTPWFDADVETLVGRPGLRGLVVPRAEAGDWLEALAGSGPVVALVETAAGVVGVRDVCASGIVRLAFGELDLRADLGIAPDSDALEEAGVDSLLLARSALVLASRAARLPGPVDGVCTALSDPEAVRRQATRARRLGFTGKLCIHPRQVEDVHAAFEPGEAQVRWALEVLEMARKGGVSVIDGRMVDRPVVEQARNILGTHHRGVTMTP